MSKLKSTLLDNKILKATQTKERLSYFKIIPHASTKNFRANEVALVLNKCFEGLSSRIVKEDKIYYTDSGKVGYYIHITKKEGVTFYLILTNTYESLILEKLRLSWDKVEIQRVDSIPNFNSNCTKLSMSYTKQDALSLNIDVSEDGNRVLESQINVLDVLNGDDESVGIYYNFIPISPYGLKGFNTKYIHTMDKIDKGQSINKFSLRATEVGKNIGLGLVGVSGALINSAVELLGGTKDNSLDKILKEKRGIPYKSDLSEGTLKKSQFDVVDTQILILSSAKEKATEKANAKILANSFSVVEGDNSLYSSVVKSVVDLDSAKFPISVNKMGVYEVGMFISQPTLSLIDKYNIKANLVTEEVVPKGCRDGYISLGTNINRGMQTKASLVTNPDIDNGLTVVGKQGSGKTEYLKNYVYCCTKGKEEYSFNRDKTLSDLNRKIKMVSEDSTYESMLIEIKRIEGVRAKDPFTKDCVVVLDYIADNDLSNTVECILTKDDIIIDLSKTECLQSLAYNELYYTHDMDIVSKLDVIGNKTQYTMELINELASDELTSQMRRYFSACSNITYAYNQFASIKDVIDCLEDYNKRMYFIDNINEEFKDLLKTDISSALALNEVDKKTGEYTGETIYSKIDRILDRVSVMRESMRTRIMFEKSAKDNINFEDCFKDGRSIVIKMRQDIFGSEHIRNFLAVFFTTKVWIASLNRKSNAKKGEPLRRVHFIIDEPHQVPKIFDMLIPKMPQMRKQRLKPVFATQSLIQLESINDSMKSSGFSYMLLSGADKANYVLLKEELLPYTVNDLLQLDRHCSLNLVTTDNGRLKPFTTKLPPMLKVGGKE